MIQLLGATPVFVDIDPQTFNMDPVKLAATIKGVREQNPTRLSLPKSITTIKPRAIIAVDLFGPPADYEAISPTAANEGLGLTEDAAQAFGAEFKKQKACSFGAVGCTYFFPAKPLGAYGDGGMCFTSDDTLAAAMKSIRVHGEGADKYENIRLGINGRLDTIQAAVLLAKFEIFQEELQQRQDAARRYNHLLASISEITLPRSFADRKSVWAQYSVLARNEALRARIRTDLQAAGIPTAVYYPLPLHL